MAQKQHAPGVQGRRAGAKIKIQYKGNTYQLKKQEYIVFSVLISGGQWATYNVAESLNIPDPRSVIRYLRKKGLNVRDRWVRERGMRFKRYWLEKDEVQICRMPELFDEIAGRKKVL